MRILIHTDEYYPTAQACSYRMRTMVDAFIDQGDEVVVVASSTNKGNGKIEPRREKILYSPAIRMKEKTTVMRMLNNFSFGFTSIFTALKAGKVDVVITTSPPPLVSIPGWIIAKCKGVKLVYDVRDIWPDVALEMGSFAEGSIYCKVFRAITRFMYKHADWVTTVSPGKVEKIKNHVISVGGKKGGPGLALEYAVVHYCRQRHRFRSRIVNGSSLAAGKQEKRSPQGDKFQLEFHGIRI